MKLKVENEPEIEEGDKLKIFPSIGKPYTATVTVEGPAVIRAKSATLHGMRSRPYHKEELEEWYVTGDLLINP